MDYDRLEPHLRLALATGLGPLLTRRMLDAFGSAEAVCSAKPSALRQVEGIGEQSAHRIRRGLDEADVQREWALIQRYGVRLLTMEDPEYPPLLRHIPDPPPLLYVRGALHRQDSLSLGLVGSRRCTAYGREQADRISAACAQAGLTIVSGGARGIDSAGHRAAVRVKGRTIAVMGCGLAHCYPPENHDLFETIAATPPTGDKHAPPGGALISELPMSIPPKAENFPRRNRIISGLSLGVLVVEASARSGALITARLAAEEHHREVTALPGRVDSQASIGCHKIIREGWATLVTNAADVLDALGEAGQMLRAALPDPEPIPSATRRDGKRTKHNGGAERVDLFENTLTDAQRTILETLEGETTPIDLLCRNTGLHIAVIQSELAQLQLRGLVTRLPGNHVRRRE